MIDADMPPALFLADTPGLDFLNSIATPVDVPVDWIKDGKGLLLWLEQAELVPIDVLKAIRKRASAGELDKIAEQARNLREWFRGFVRQNKGHPLTAHAMGKLGPLNRLLERDHNYHQIRIGADGVLGLQTFHRWSTAEDLLLAVGEVLARLITTENFTNVKACEGQACTLLFADHTKGHARRWCSMAICGNRAKQAAHRRRQKPHTH